MQAGQHQQRSQHLLRMLSLLRWAAQQGSSSAGARRHGGGQIPDSHCAICCAAERNVPNSWAAAAAAAAHPCCHASRAIPLHHCALPARQPQPAVRAAEHWAGVVAQPGHSGELIGAAAGSQLARRACQVRTQQLQAGIRGSCHDEQQRLLGTCWL